MAHCTRGGDDMRRQRQAEARLQGLTGKGTTIALVAAKYRRAIAEVLAGFDGNLAAITVIFTGVDSVGEVAPAEGDVVVVTLNTNAIAHSARANAATIDGDT